MNKAEISAIDLNLLEELLQLAETADILNMFLMHCSTWRPPR